MEQKCIYFDSNLGFIPAICSGDIRDEITSDRLNETKSAICIGVTPEEVTGKQYYIYIEESLFNQTKDIWF